MMCGKTAVDEDMSMKQIYLMYCYNKVNVWFPAQHIFSNI